MQAKVSRGYLQSLGYSAWDLIIPNWSGVDQCKPQITSSEVTFTIPYSGCGTTQQVSLGLLPCDLLQGNLSHCAVCPVS